MPSIRLRPEPSSGDQWADLSTSGHSLELYERDEELIEGLARFAGAALAGGDPFLMIATQQHRTALEQLFAAEWHQSGDVRVKRALRGA
jgi:hypothetical protein